MRSFIVFFSPFMMFLLMAPGLVLPSPVKALPTSEQELVTSVRSALDKKNVEMMLDLVCWDGVDSSMKDSLKATFQYLVSQKVKDVNIGPLRPGAITEYVLEGKKFKTNLTPIKQLNIVIDDGDPNGKLTTSLMVGQKGNDFLIATAAQVK